MMRVILSSLLFCFYITSAAGQTTYFPPISGYAWDSITPSSLNWCEPEIDSLLAYLDRENTKSFIVLKNGKIVIEAYFDAFDRDSLWIWFSAGKSLTSVLTGIAQQEGSLTINDNTSSHLGQGWTSMTLAKEDLITVSHQLSMTTGIDESVSAYCTIDTCLTYAADAGTRWVYHNPPYSLLRDVIESATGINYNIYTYLKLHTRTGMDGFWLPVGYNNFYFSTARSMARFGLLMLNKGIWNNDTILTDTSYFNAMINTSQSLNLSYGYLWWLNGKASYIPPGLTIPLPGFIAPDAPSDMYVAAGAEGQFICVVPSLDMVVIRNGTSSTTSTVPVLFLNDIWKKLNPVFCSQTGIDEPNDSNVLLYPNPSANEINVRSENKIIEIEIFDATGRRQSVNFQNSSFDISHLNSDAVYFIRITTSAGSTVQKFIKQ